MIPYLEPPVLAIGAFRLHPFGLLAATAIFVGSRIVWARAPRAGVGSDKAIVVVAWAVVSGLVGSHVFSEIAYFPSRVRANPLVLLNLFGSMSAFGGILFGLAGGIFGARREGVSPGEIWRIVDQIAYAFPFAWIFGRAGCALVHDHPGIRTDHWLAVRFPDGPRFDLGLLELLYTIPIALLFLALGRRPRRTGLFVGLFFVLYGPFRILADQLRVDEVRYLGWTPSQYTSLALTAAGVVILWKMRAQGSSSLEDGNRPTGSPPKRRSRSKHHSAP